MILFATCGRGLEDFAKEELNEYEMVCCSQVVAEGKILFCVCSLMSDNEDLEDKMTFKPLANAMSHKRLKNCIANQSSLHSLYISRWSLSPSNLCKLSSLRNMKLIEKLFIVLYYDTVNFDEKTEIYAKKATEAIFDIEYKNIMEVVNQLKMLPLEKHSLWQGCSKPETCFAFNQRHMWKNISLNRKQKHDFQDIDNAELNSALSQFKNVPAKRLKCEDDYEYSVKCAAQTFLVSCRIRGMWRKLLKPQPFSKDISNVILQSNQTWTQVIENPNLNLYVNLNDECIIVGASLTEKPLSLRSYIPHISLRSTLCYLMIKKAKIKKGFTILDPMAGTGTILVEAAVNIEDLRIIVNEMDPRQISSAQCNLRNFVNVEYILSDAAALPLRDKCVDAIVCDFPFGRKHVISSYKDLMPRVIKECVRVCRSSCRLVFLISAQQEIFLKELVTGNTYLILESSDAVSLGLTPAFVITLVVL